jgi:hypothetical protein
MARSVCGPSTLRPVDEDDVLVLVDLVDHPELAAACGAQALEFAPQRLAGSLRVLGDRAEDRFEDGRAHLLGRSVEVPEALRRDLDLVGHLRVIPEAEPLALGSFLPRRPDRVEELAVLEDVHGLLERLEVLGRHEDGGGSAVACHDESLVLARRAIHQF